MTSTTAHSDGQPRPDQDHNLQNHEHTCCEMEVIGEKPRETREEWVISIKKMLDQANKDEDMSSWGKRCIYKVPHYLNENDNKSYFPQTVSLGPYHHGKKHLQSMEPHKWRVVNRVLKRSNNPTEKYIDAIEYLEKEARACYQGLINMNSRAFTQMLVLDGCFVLELLMGTFEGFHNLQYAPNDPVFAMRGLMHSIQRDMVMLENQLPLFVLERLLQIQLGTKNKTGVVADLAIQFFNPLMPTGVELTKPKNLELMKWLRDFPDSQDEKKQWHCLDVFRQSLLCSSAESEQSFLKKITQKVLDVFRQSLLQCCPKQNQSPEETTQNILSWNTGMDKTKQQLIHCVTELKEAGIKFRKANTDRF